MVGRGRGGRVKRTLDDGTRHVGFGEEGVFVDELVVGIFFFFFAGYVEVVGGVYEADACGAVGPFAVEVEGHDACACGACGRG